MALSLQDVALRVLTMVARGVVGEQDAKKKFPYHTIYVAPQEMMDEVEDFSQGYGMARVLHPELGEDGKPASQSQGQDYGKGDGNDKRKSAECVVLFVGGHRTHPIVIATPDRRYHPHDPALDQQQGGQQGGQSGGGGAQATALAATGQAGGQQGSQSQDPKNLKAGEWCLYDDQGNQFSCTRGGFSATIQNDKNISVRVAKSNAGSPDKPMRDLQHYKTKPSEIQHSYAMDKDGFTVTVQDSEGGAATRSGGGPAIRHVFCDSQGNVRHSMTMHSGGIDWTADGDMSHTSKGKHDILTGGRVGLHAGGASTRRSWWESIQQFAKLPIARSSTPPQIKIASTDLQMTDLDSLDDIADRRSLGESGPHKKLKYKP
jgi:phage gp45-like